MQKMIYSLEEYASNPESLDASADMVRAAFTFTGKTEAELKEAKKLVKDFKNKEVKQHDDRNL